MAISTAHGEPAPDNKAVAILFGAALGDALGYAVEFMSLSAIRAQHGEFGIIHPPDPALYSDDTQMTLALARGLTEAGINAPISTLMDAIGNAFVEWVHHPENNRAPGATTLRGMERYEGGMHWGESGIAESKGCGSAMRVAALGYVYQKDEHKLREVAHASSMITHRHPTGIAAAVAAAYLVKLALDGVSTCEYLPRVMTFTTGMSAELDDAFRRIGHVGAWSNEEEALEHIGRGWAGDEAVALALYCVMRSPDDYVACMRRAANTEGDSDSIACIAGGIMGARLGMSAIPQDWIARCEHRVEIEQLAKALAAERQRVYPSRDSARQ